MSKTNSASANGAKPNTDSANAHPPKANMPNSITTKKPEAAPPSNNNTVKSEIPLTDISTFNHDATVIANTNTNSTPKDAKSKRSMISMKQIANKASNNKDKITSPDHEHLPKTEETLLSEKPKPKPEPIARKESLQVLVVPPNSDSPKNFRTNSRLSVSSTRRLSVESHRSLDFNPLPNNGAAQSAPLPAEVDDKYLLLQSADDSYIRSAIPVLPIPAAVICLLINIVLPGFGTALSGLSVICCGRPRIRAKGDTRSVTCCINVFVGICQLCTISLCFVGWAWSLAWGILLVHFAVHFNRQKKQRRQVELQALALRAFTTNESGRKLPF